MLGTIETRPIMVNGIGADMWAAIDEIKAGGFPVELPDPLMFCGECGRTWMREHLICPICENPTTLRYKDGTQRTQ